MPITIYGIPNYDTVKTVPALAHWAMSMVELSLVSRGDLGPLPPIGRDAHGNCTAVLFAPHSRLRPMFSRLQEGNSRRYGLSAFRLSGRETDARAGSCTVRQQR